MIEIGNFYTAGVNYKKSDTTLRGRFAISIKQYEIILRIACDYDVSSLFVLSTCNRTEIYGTANKPDDLVNLLCSVTDGGVEEFKANCYIKKGTDAVDHIFNVVAGLDSQILGDYEIAGQFKKAVSYAKAHGFINTFLEKLHNTVLQASKQIKNETGLSKGTTSVSFAVVQAIKQHYVDATNILIVGAGKMGELACKNIKDYLGGFLNIMLVNRSVANAKRVADDMKVCYGSMDKLRGHIAAADVIIVATASAKPVIHKADLQDSSKKLIIDLSIPNNVEPSISELPNVKLINIDELSLVNCDTLQKRRSEVCAAKEINACFIIRFIEWCEIRRRCLQVHTIKKQLTSICLNRSEAAPVGFISLEDEQRIQKILNKVVGKMKGTRQAGCHHLEAVNEFMFPLVYHQAG